MKRVHEEGPSYILEPVFWEQILQLRGEFRCIPAIVWMTHSEAVWSRTAEPGCVGSDIGARLQSVWLTWGGYLVRSDKICGRKIIVFQENSNSYSYIYTNGRWRPSGQEKNERMQSQPVQSRTCRVRGPEVQKFRKREIQQSKNPVTCDEPVS